ncbi:MAG: SGNH/GDSL hydrolase family protein [Cytophagales bacterium]|nr:SGNH/GDSL hydrolase family protein [Bernardetiaceae bacterium]MDW8211604.1 SGNH/GDSL hydrolase family protein [Cytophagales bacterium]
MRLHLGLSFGIAGLIGIVLWVGQLKIKHQQELKQRQAQVKDSLEKVARLQDSLKQPARIVPKQNKSPKVNELVFNHKSSRATGKVWRILLTGDSMGDGLFLAWRKLCQQGNFEIRYQPWYGSTTESWATTDRLENMIKQYRPSLVIFSLGSNQLRDHQIRKKGDHIREIIRQFGNTEFVWIGPPNWREDTGINELIKKYVGKERFFESRGLTFERRKDGIHPTEKSAAVWADTIRRWIDQNPCINFYFLEGKKAFCRQ